MCHNTVKMLFERNHYSPPLQFVCNIGHGSLEPNLGQTVVLTPFLKPDKCCQIQTVKGCLFCLLYSCLSKEISQLLKLLKVLTQAVSARDLKTLKVLALQLHLWI